MFFNLTLSQFVDDIADTFHYLCNCELAIFFNVAVSPFVNDIVVTVYCSCHCKFAVLFNNTIQYTLSQLSMHCYTVCYSHHKLVMFMNATASQFVNNTANSLCGNLVL